MAELVYTDIAFAQQQEVRARKLMRIILWVFAIVTFSWAVAFLFFIRGDRAAAAFDSAIAMLAFASLYYERRFAFRVFAHVFIWLAFISIWFIQLKIEGLSRTEFASVNQYFLVLAVATVLFLIHENRLVLGGYVAMAFGSFALCGFRLFESPSMIPLSPEGTVLAHGVTFVTVFLTVILLTLAWAREVQDAEEKLTTANNRMEELLANMLPRAISERLRRDGKTFADGIAECSVMFVDIVGFTKMSSKMPPNELVHLLDEIFSKFDELTVNAGLEKIKTIGDSYMVAAGLPDRRADHAQALIKLAMDMQAVIRGYGLHIRCGINSGNVVAGVIGRKRFIYDLWGDTVNVASRMESQGVTDEIQITEATANLVREQFDVVRQEDISVKGKGDMPVYLVAGVNFGARRIPRGN
jgi:class 3 adenylate cyclase